jgi:hypothetical protein
VGSLISSILERSLKGTHDRNLPFPSPVQGYFTHAFNILEQSIAAYSVHQANDKLGPGVVETEEKRVVDNVLIG